MRSDKKFQIFSHAVLILFSLLALLPMILILTSSLTDNNEIIANGYTYFPKKWSLYAYEYIFKTGNSVIHAYGISVVLTIVGTALALTITTLLAYAISKKGMPGRGVITFLVVFSMLFNGGLVPTYIIYTNVLGIKNSFLSLLIPGLLMNGFNVMLMKSYFVSSIPEEILDAAYIDGAGEVRTFLSVVTPLSKPILATVALFAGIGYWNDWIHIYHKKNRPLFCSKPLKQNDAKHTVSFSIKFKHTKCKCGLKRHSYGFGSYGYGNGGSSSHTCCLPLRAEILC